MNGSGSVKSTAVRMSSVSYTCTGYCLDFNCLRYFRFIDIDTAMDNV